MKSTSIVGILLIVLGVIALTYQGITYTTKKKVLDIGPIQATKEEHKTIPLPPILGGIATRGRDRASYHGWQEFIIRSTSINSPCASRRGNDGRQFMS